MPGVSIVIMEVKVDRSVRFVVLCDGDCEFAVVLFANLGVRTDTHGANGYWLVISSGSCFVRM